MRFFLLVVVGLIVVPGAYSQNPIKPDPYGEHVAKSAPRTPDEERKAFHLPPGFDIQLVAAEPMVRKPININFDDRGRLWVTGSIEYPFAAPLGSKSRDTIRILEELADNALARKGTTFVDDLNIPIGVLPVTHGAIAFSIPNIYRLDDPQGRDHADSRHVLYGRFGFKDTHGMTGEFTRGYDGWIYACHGFSNTSKVKGKNGTAIVMQSGNTYRFKPDGSHVEQFTHGQVNPFGLAFDPLGNLYSCDCHTRPIMMLLRGGHYQSFGSPDDGLGFAPDMCDHDHGSTAIAGITYYAADQFPPEYRDTIFVGNVVTNRINHDRLEKHGSTYKAIELPDFLRCDDPWFRPVDIKLGPDGALYVADFYNRIIGHYEVPLTHPGRDRERGRIWRIVYKGSGNPLAPQPTDWTRASVPHLIHGLANTNLTNRMTAMNQLVERGGQAGTDAVRDILRPNTDPNQRRHGLWVLERMGSLKDSHLEDAAKDADTGVRCHALKILTERPDLSQRFHQVVVTALKDPDAFVRRNAAEALGKHLSPKNICPLLALRASVADDDTHLLHMVRMALRNQLLPGENWKELAKSSVSEADARVIADVAPGVPSPEAADFLLVHLDNYADKPDRQARYAHHVARYGVKGSELKLLGVIQKIAGTHLDLQHQLFQSVQQGAQERGEPLPEPLRAWGKDLTKNLLASSRAHEVSMGIELAGTLKIKSLQTRLQNIVTNIKVDSAQRLAALAALAAINPGANVLLMGQLLDNAAESIAFRETVAQALSTINEPSAQAELLKVLPLAPERLAIVIATGLAGTPAGAEKLLDTITAGKASPRLLQEKGVELRLRESHVLRLQERLSSLLKGLPPADARWEKLLRQRREGFGANSHDAAAGLKIFEKSCANCHQISNKGAKVGPQLDGVGIRGLDRLLEDILDPSRNVDQAFRTTTLSLKNGQIVSGLLLREEGEVLVLADNQGKEVRVPKNTVEERALSPLSPMPANFAEQIPEKDFYQLLAYLLSQRPLKDAARARVP